MGWLRARSKCCKPLAVAVSAAVLLAVSALAVRAQTLVTIQNGKLSRVGVTGR